MGMLNLCKNFGKLHRAKREFDREKERHVLSYLFWETTLACNLNCRHCGSRCSPAIRRQNDLPGEDVKRIFREIAEDFGTSEIVIAVTGGEPLVRDDVFEVMAAANDLGFSWGMVTNGVLITEDVLRKMEHSGMSAVSVSIDGDEEAHAKLRGSREAYRRSMEGLALLTAQASFLDIVEVTTVVNSHNVHLLNQMYDSFFAMGVDEWRLLMIDPIGRMKDDANCGLMLTGEQLAETLDFVAMKRKSGPMPITFEESGFLGLRYEGQVRDYYFHCPAGINIGSVLHDGQIGACPSLERVMVEGDAKSERFSEVWNSRFQRYRDRVSTRRKGLCASCKWWNYCEGGSLHLWDWDREKTRLCHYRMLEEAQCLR